MEHVVMCGRSFYSEKYLRCKKGLLQG